MGTCSKCGKSTPGKYRMCYPCNERHKRKAFLTYGRRSCKRCGRAIPGNRTYCWSCIVEKAKNS